LPAISLWLIADKPAPTQSRQAAVLTASAAPSETQKISSPPLEIPLLAHM